MNKRFLTIAVWSLPAIIPFVLAALSFAPASSTPSPVGLPYVLSEFEFRALGTTHIPELVALRVSRGDLPVHANRAIGALICLPFLIGYLTFLILMLLYDNLGASILLLALLVTIGVAFIWFGLDQFGAVLIVIAVAIPLVTAAIFPKPGRWRRSLHMVITTCLFLSAVVLSFTTYRILTRYSGSRPASQVEPDRLLTLFENLTRSRVPQGVRDVSSWHITQIPSLNTTTTPMTIFAINRLAAKWYIILSIIYLLGIWVIVIPAEQGDTLSQPRDSDTESLFSAEKSSASVRERPPALERLIHVIQRPSERSGRQIPHYARVIFAVPFYLSVGVAFAIMYFNVYIAAAAKQNVMLLYADFMQASDSRYTEIEEALQSFGPTESLVLRMLEAAKHRSNGTVSATLNAARARYWPSAVIAQELPRVVPAPNVIPTATAMSSPDVTATGPVAPAAVATPQTEMILDPELTFADMLYFSFVSFTTTGYGDIRPISDELRFWTICENIVEVLFTAMFFAVAMEPDPRREEQK